MRKQEAIQEARRLSRQRRNGDRRFLIAIPEPTGAIFPDGTEEFTVAVAPNFGNDVDERGMIWTPGCEVHCECNRCWTGI